MKALCAVFLLLFFAVPVAAVDVPILMYHDFVPDDAVCGEFAVTESRFREHLSALRDAGYETVTFEEVIAYADGTGELPLRPVLLTADDGYCGVADIAVPLAEEYGMEISCAVIGAMAGDGEHFSLGHPAACETEIISHTFDLHKTDERGCGVCMVSSEELREDIGRMRAYAGGAFPMVGEVFVYPYGAYSPETEDVFRESGYRVTVTCACGIAQAERGGDLFALPRIGVYQVMSGADVLAAIGRFSQS